MKKNEFIGSMPVSGEQGFSVKEYGMYHPSGLDSKVNTLRNLMGSVEVVTMPEFFSIEYRRELVKPLLKSLKLGICEYERELALIERDQEEFVSTIVKNCVKLSVRSGSGTSEYANTVREHASEVSHALKRYYYDFKMAELGLMHVTQDEWKPRLNAVREMLPEIAYRHYSLCVSVSRDFHFLEKRSEAISASMITENRLDLYGCDERKESCRLGWVFSPEVEDILGMAPAPDANTEIERSAGYLNTSIFYSLDEFRAGFLHARDGTGGEAFLRMYPYEIFIERTETFNEVILSGNTKPFAIFALKTVCKEPELVNKVNVLATVLNMPIVCLDRDENKATLTRQLTG